MVHPVWLSSLVSILVLITSYLICCQSRHRSSRTASHHPFPYIYVSVPDLPSPCSLIFALSPYSTFLPDPDVPNTPIPHHLHLFTAFMLQVLRYQFFVLFPELRRVHFQVNAWKARSKRYDFKKGNKCSQLNKFLFFSLFYESTIHEERIWTKTSERR